MDKKSIIFLGISILCFESSGFKIDSYCNYYATVHHCIVYYKVEILE